MSRVWASGTDSPGVSVPSHGRGITAADSYLA